MKKKIFSAFAVFALSAALPLAACVNNGGGEESTKPAPQIVGNTYYVSADGNSNGDGSEANPYDITTVLNDWIGIAERQDKILAPGDTVLVKPGVYKLNSRLRMMASGVHNGMITVKNASTTGEKVILDFSAMAFDGNNRGVEIYSDYVHWYGIDICGAGDNGMYIGGSYNVVEYSEFYNNRDTGLQLGRKFAEDNTIENWPSYNLIKNCTSHNNYDNETYGENADGFAAKLTVGFGNVFDGCIAYRNSDDGWDLYAKTDSGNIGQVILYNCVAFENGYLEYTQRDNNKLFPTWNGSKTESIDEDKQPVLTGEEKYGKLSFKTRDGDGNGFKLGGSVMEGDVLVYNCLAFNNRMHGVTDNSNPGYLKLDGVTSYNNSANVDDNPFIINPETGELDVPNPNFGYIVNKAYDLKEGSETYGQVVNNPNHDTHGNINVSRQTYSYNTVKNTVSVKDNYAISLEADEYRGSVTNSLLIGTERANKILGSIDADSKFGKRYTELVNTLVSTEVFEKLPFEETSDYVYKFNIAGVYDLGTIGGFAEATDTETAKPNVIQEYNANRVHHKYRNSDGSINMGDILKIKDYTKLLGEETKIGANVSLSSWEEYAHMSEADWSSQTSSAINAIIVKAKEVLTINTDEDAVYQDFDVASKLGVCTIDWSSSDEKLIKVNALRSEDIMTSKAEYVTLSVIRPTDGDKKVTLTAKISYLNRSLTKDFVLTVKKDTPSIGNLYVHVNAEGEDIIDGGRVILDMYRQYEEPALLVENGAYYNGTLLKADQYTVTTKYEYALADSNSDKDYRTVAVFTPNKAGVFRITHTVKLNGSDETKSMTYKIFVASTTAQIDFVGDASIVVNRDGYTIGGALNSPTGKIYAASSATDLGEIDATQLKGMEGLKSYEFRDTAIIKQFDSVTNNSAKYYIYYALENLDGVVTSKVYKTEIKVVEISTATAFMKVAGGGTIGSGDSAEVPEETIYLLTTDLNFSSVTWQSDRKTFTGFFNGNGHKISNLTATLDSTTNNLGIFHSLKGGTIENIKFENVTVDGGRQQTGIIGTMYGGYVHNISLTNVTIKGETRVGFIGHAFESSIPTYITNISIVNDAEHKITGNGQRVAGIIGLIQTTSAPEDGVEVYVSDCYINTYIKGSQQVGGIIGSFDNAKAGTPYYLEIDHCVFVGTAETDYATPRVGGIIGYQSGAIGYFYIHHCVSVGTLINKAEITTSLKTASPIVGGFASTAVNFVENCASLMEEYNTDYDVSSVALATLTTYNFFFAQTGFLKFNTEYWSAILKDPNAAPGSRDYNVLIAPYVTLNFIEN